ncbi:MAG TPA: RDD family protein [Xanthomonadaceae bacterium]|nr:RDD family protein [Xanthomonadaceae bacterium]
MLDTEHCIATPEGVELRLRLAGPVPRALAWLIDLLWRGAALFALVLVLLPFQRFGIGLFLIGWFMLEWLVPAWCEAEWGGATPGKKALGLVVVRDDGAPIGWGPALTRNLLRFADFLPLLYLGGLVAMLWNRQFKRLGDYVAGTLVVYAEHEAPSRRIPAADPKPPLRPLSLDEARVVLDFAERAPELGSARAEELAYLAEPLLDGTDAAVEQLNAVANHLIGTQTPRHASA